MFDDSRHDAVKRFYLAVEITSIIIVYSLATIGLASIVRWFTGG